MTCKKTYKQLLCMAVAILMVITCHAQAGYKADFESIKKYYAQINSYEVPVEFGMYDLKTAKLIQKSSGILLQTAANKYYKSAVLESITYNELCVDVYHTDKTIIVSKKLAVSPTNLNPLSYLMDNYVKVNNAGDKDGNRTYDLIFNSGMYSKISINFNLKLFSVNYIKIYEKESVDVDEPIVIEIKYGKVIPKKTSKDNFPIEKYVLKTASGFKCQPAFVNYELMDTYSN